MYGEAKKSPRSRSYVEEVFHQLQNTPNVSDIVILNKHGHPIKSSMKRAASVEFAGLYEVLHGKLLRGMAKIDPSDQLLMLRVRTKAHEVLLTPDSNITVLVVQNAEDKFQK